MGKVRKICERIGPKWMRSILAIVIGLAVSTVYAYGCEDTSSITLIRLANEERVNNGMPELVEDATLDAIAQTRANEMAASGVFSHTRPDGTKFQTAYVINGQYVTKYGQENLARGYSSSQKAFDGWKASESHLANILNSRVTRIGAGVAFGTDGKMYYVTEFAQ